MLRDLSSVFCFAPMDLLRGKSESMAGISAQNRKGQKHILRAAVTAPRWSFPWIVWGTPLHITLRAVPEQDPWRGSGKQARG